MDLGELKLKDLEQLKTVLGGGGSKLSRRKQITDGKIRIVVLQRGWVYVGRYYQDGQDCRLENAACIRIWGTSKGLNELVTGPTANTKLDPTPLPVEFHELTVCFTLHASEDGWAKHLKQA